MARSDAKTVAEYIAALPADRQKTINTVRATMKKCLPKGFVEEMGFGVITYNVPKSVLAETYNGLPLMYAGLGAQKNYNVVYMMTANQATPVGRKMAEEFKAAGKKLNMGGSCVRFREVDDISLDAIGNAIASMSVASYVELYQQSRLDTVAGKKKAAKKAVRKTS